MPTEYTARVADGSVTDFRTFALTCARAFGPCILQRDQAISVLPELREVAFYYRESVALATARLARVSGMTLQDAEVASEAEWKERDAQFQQSLDDAAVQENRYNAMRANVVQWEAPTSDHQALKTFMLDQLREGKKWDAQSYLTPPLKRTAESWLVLEQAAAQLDLEHATRNFAEEQERCDKANAWITALYDSLSSPPQTTD